MVAWISGRKGRQQLAGCAGVAALLGAAVVGSGVVYRQSPALMLVGGVVGLAGLGLALWAMLHTISGLPALERRNSLKRQVDRSRAVEHPHLVWNAFIDIVATEDYDELSWLQQMAHLAFWYESEVQNGGHGQYFENRGRNRLAETVGALRDLGLGCQAAVLSRALEYFAKAAPDEDWNDVLPEGFTEELDAGFHACKPDVTAALKEHLQAHLSEYVELT